MCVHAFQMVYAHKSCLVTIFIRNKKLQSHTSSEGVPKFVWISRNKDIQCVQQCVLRESRMLPVAFGRLRLSTHTIPSKKRRNV